MFKNYFKIAWRNLWKNKTYSFLNIFGLAIGIACAGLIFLWVEHEVNWDSNNTNKNSLYIARVNASVEGGVFTHSSTPGLMAPAMQQQIPGIENTCRTSEATTPLLFSNGDKSMYASGKYAEPSLFSMFTLPFMQGNTATAFQQLHSIVLTEKTAKKFFGTEINVLGKTVRVDNNQDYVVTGVLKDIPENASLQFEWLMPFTVFFQNNPGISDWKSFSISTYVQLKQGANVTSINKQLYNFVQQREPTSNGHIFLFSMNDWHLRNAFENGKPSGGGLITYVRLFSIIAWIILIIACINFMNLATAGSERRSKEVGVKKVLGADKKRLVMQFISEAMLMAFLAAIVAVLIITLALPAFNTLVQKNLSLALTNPTHISALVLITIICGVVAGSYPSFYLSSFKPIFVLKGIKSNTGSAMLIRKGLVVVQFAISIILIIGTIIIYQQIQHIKSRELGFNKNNLIQTDVAGNIANHFTAIKQDLMNTGLVENVALSDHATLYSGDNSDGISWEGKPAGNKILISWRDVSPKFISTSGMHVIEGRDFQQTDTTNLENNVVVANVIITQSLAKMLGTGSAIGKILFDENDTLLHATVVGVMNDYVYGNMYGKPDPVMFYCVSPRIESVMYIRTKAQSNPQQALAKIETVMHKNNPAYPFTYQFVDDQFNQMFLSEMLVSKLSKVFSTLAIIISCLGLFGLAAYTAQRRIKEIGIRKVLGASVAGITTLLSKEFLQLIGVACFIAFPVAWWMMHNWLQNYQYRIEISWWIFLIAGLLAIAIALITISFQSIKAAIANPVKSLRTE
jgi:putative ABC transport system permease protein